MLLAPPPLPFMAHTVRTLSRVGTGYPGNLQPYGRHYATETHMNDAGPIGTTAFRKRIQHAVKTSSE